MSDGESNTAERISELEKLGKKPAIKPKAAPEPEPEA